MTSGYLFGIFRRFSLDMLSYSQYFNFLILLL